MSAADYRPPAQTGLPILLVTEGLIVLDKPAGLLTVPGRGPDKADCLAARVQAGFPDALIVHRLDMATSGIVVMARGARCQRALSVLFQERQVEKRYQALVDGLWSDAEEGEISLPLIADWPNRPRQKVDHDIGRPSLTRYRLMGTDAAAGVSRIELTPVTGRSHQLRVHLAVAGHPILGDDLYGTESSTGKADRLMLHACHIAFRDPESGQPIRVSCPPPF